MFGLALVFLLTPNENGRRFGRRANDVGRRKEDVAIPRATIQDNSELIASTLAATENLLDAAAKADIDPIVRERIDRALQAKPANEKTQHRPSPVFYYDESTIAKLKEGGQVAVKALLDEPTDSNQDQASSDGSVSTLEVDTKPSSESSEHPNDAGFRDFLLDELAKSNDRRQHPRPADSSTPRTVQLGMRESTRSQPG